MELIAKSIFDFKESKSDAVLPNAFAVKNAAASSIAELTLKPVDKRVWVEPIRLEVRWSVRRFEATACDRLTELAMLELPF
jgi:hypothetical protein